PVTAPSVDGDDVPDMAALVLDKEDTLSDQGRGLPVLDLYNQIRPGRLRLRQQHNLKYDLKYDLKNQADRL
ncbi:MAG: hypothetical protein D3918_16270, partial [Candidatus Electrothrix sp. AX2]|nr:hypothetical protein [Candidatus Electrothrix gigas]